MRTQLQQKAITNLSLVTAATARNITAHCEAKGNITRIQLQAYRSFICANITAGERRFLLAQQTGLSNE